MKKIKILETSSQEYEEGRIDRFLFLGNQDIHKELISLLNNLGVSNERLEDLDVITTSEERYFFIFEKPIKIHLLITKELITLLIDSKLSREEIMAEMEKNFQLF